MKKHILTSIVLLVSCYLFMFFWWVTIYLRALVDTKENYYFGVVLGLFTILCGILGLKKIRNYGSFSSSIGKFIIFLSSGFIAWGIGTLVIGYYNLVLNQSYPYPSLADVAYIISWPLWTTGMIYLLRVLGVKYRFKRIIRKSFFVIIPLITIAISYYLLFIFARGGVVDFSQNGLKLFFDLAYPIGDIVIITLVVLIYSLSINYLGGVLRFPILVIMFGFFLNYFTDIVFIFTITKGTYFVANWVDLIYVTVFFLLGLGLVQLGSAFNKIKSEGLMETPGANGLNVSITGTIPILNQVILAIIKRQERVAGQIAWEEAKEVPELTIVDQQKEEIAVSGNSVQSSRKVIDDLVSRYKHIFGDLAVQVSKDATRHLLAELPKNEVPESLK